MVAQCSVDEERVGSVKVGVSYIPCEAVNDTYDVSSMKAASNYYDYLYRFERDKIASIYLENIAVFIISWFLIYHQIFNISSRILF